MDDIPVIKLYGAKGCHKAHYYQLILNEIGLSYTFLDVEQNEDHAEELRSLYENRKLNFPTITIGKKKLRNPYKEELIKWINKLIPNRLDIVHDKKNKRFVLNINEEIAKVDYQLRNNKMYLIHSEVPYHLRGEDIGKILVEKTFEKLTTEGYEAIAVCSYIKAVARRNKKWNTIISQN